MGATRRLHTLILCIVCISQTVATTCPYNTQVSTDFSISVYYYYAVLYIRVIYFLLRLSVTEK